MNPREHIALVEHWHGIRPPNDAALEFLRDLDRLMAAFAALPSEDFSDEPADFAAMLDAFAEQD